VHERPPTSESEAPVEASALRTCSAKEYRLRTEADRFGLDRLHELSANPEATRFWRERDYVDLHRVAAAERQYSSDNRAVPFGHEHEQTIFFEACLSCSCTRGRRAVRRKLRSYNLLQSDQFLD
jgi:hypothetical protein